MHLWALNRAILLTPFHNMALMCPADGGRRGPHTETFSKAMKEMTTG